MKYVQLLIGMTKFLIYPSPSLHKITHLRHYSKLYLSLIQHNQTIISKSIKQLHNIQQKQQNQKTLTSQISKTKQNLKQKLVIADGQNIDGQAVRDGLNKYINKGFQYMGLYYQSLQGLVEGKRQVLYDQKFKFQDGQSVKQKQQKMQKYLRKLFGEKIVDKQDRKQ